MLYAVHRRTVTQAIAADARREAIVARLCDDEDRWATANDNRPRSGSTRMQIAEVMLSEMSRGNRRR